MLTTDAILLKKIKDFWESIKLPNGGNQEGEIALNAKIAAEPTKNGSHKNDGDLQTYIASDISANNEKKTIKNFYIDIDKLTDSPSSAPQTNNGSENAAITQNDGNIPIIIESIMAANTNQINNGSDSPDTGQNFMGMLSEAFEQVVKDVNT
jgi:hypothetical protein